jgi:nucleoside-diphosphate-sugar epimerase
MALVLVTGATGGLGLAVVPALLARGHTVRASGRSAAAGARLRELGASFAAAELTTPDTAAALVANADAVVHAAALSGPWGSPALFDRVNIQATAQLLAAAQAAGCGRFVYISTPSIYAAPRDRLGLTEASPAAQPFANAYAASKYAAERLVLAANAPGFATIVLRPRALVGPDDRVLLPRLLRVARQGWFPLLRGGRALVELTDVRDAAGATAAALEAGAAASGRAFNISGGQPLSVADMLARVFPAFGLRPRLVPLPYGPAAGVARLAELVCARLPGRPEPAATVYGLTSLAFSQTFDLTAARTVLGWQPRHTPEEAIVRTAAAWGRDAAL